MDIVLKQINPLTSSAEDWNKYHFFRKIRHQEVNPGDPIEPDEAVEISAKQDFQNEEYYVEQYFVYKKNDASLLIGTVTLLAYTDKSPSYKGNEHFAQFEISLLPEFRRKGLGLKLLEKVVESTQILGKTLLITSSKESSGIEFLKKLNFNRENRLQLKDVDWSMVDQWNKEGQAKNPETKILFFDSIPDDLIDQFAGMVTETMSQAPLGSLNVSEMRATREVLRTRENEFRSVGNVPTTILTLEANGKISAFSEMYYSTNTKLILEQTFTGVKEEFRGRGLGKWVKAALLLYMSIKYPEVTAVKTGNAESNAPMLSINDRLGFKIYKEKVTAQITLEDAIISLKSFQKPKKIDLNPIQS
ncbi:MAG: GNAT family N-acetyltransferase [Candidatus Hodarchaeales archaeon]|jgi:GNAT superfamily N-acetyltransferase